MPIPEQQRALLDLLLEAHDLPASSLQRVAEIISKSEWLGLGNPKKSVAAMSPEQCWSRRANARLVPPDPSCGAPNMVPLSESGARTTACIDQYEFPNVPCAYPVVWVRSSEAAHLCAAMGKRLCDAHEWEGACAGEVLQPDRDYAWDRMPASIAKGERRQKRLWSEYEHNRTRELRWAYGPQKNHALCATGARKAPSCAVVDFSTCGTNTYPAGAFPECVSPFGAYDLHGNAAEHMNLPLSPQEMATSGGLGETEMKGSWFIFAREETHPDDCRWRAKNWHTTRIDDRNSHRNYHLGFRCCKDVAGTTTPP